MKPPNSTANGFAIDDQFVCLVATRFGLDAKQVLIKLSVMPEQGRTPTPIVEDQEAGGRRSQLYIRIAGSETLPEIVGVYSGEQRNRVSGHQTAFIEPEVLGLRSDVRDCRR